MIYETTDLDVIYYDNNTISPEIDKTLYVLTTSEPGYSNSILAKGIIGSRKPFGKLLSKWFYDTTIGITGTIGFEEPDEIGATLYRLNRSKYVLTIPSWRPINTKDPASDWILLYPLVSGMSKYFKQEGFTRMVILSSQSIHHFVESEDWLPFPPEELYVYDYSVSDFTTRPKKETNPLQEMLISPPTYLIPKIFSEFNPSAEVLSVFVGSLGIGSIDLKAAETLATWLKENESINSSKSHQNNEYKEIKLMLNDLGDTISEGLIRSKPNPSNTNGSVMFG